MQPDVNWIARDEQTSSGRGRRSRAHIAWAAAVVIIAALIMVAGTASVVRSDVGITQTTAHMAASFPHGVRNVGMGVTGVADLSPATTGHFNPASVAWMDAITFMHARNNWYPQYHHTDSRIVSPLRVGGQPWEHGFRGGVMVGYTTMSYEGGSLTPIVFLPPGTGDAYSGRDYYFSLGAGAAYKHERYEVGIGGTVKYTDAKVGTDYSSWNFDVGVIAAASMRSESGAGMRPRVGASLLNLGGSLFDVGSSGSVASPVERRAGVGVDIYSARADGFSRRSGRDVTGATVSVNLDLIDGNDERMFDPGWGWGAELTVVDLFSVRGGSTKHGVGNTSFDTFGVGANWDFGAVLLAFSWSRVWFDSTTIPLFGFTNNTIELYAFTIGARL